MDSVSYEKEHAVFSAVNRADPDHIDKLIHNSGRLQLNTYQAFVSNLMRPQSDLRSLMLVHMTGTGKTITALSTATEYVRQYDDSNAISSIIVLGFTQNIFKKELLSHPEFSFVSADESEELNILEKQMNDSAVSRDLFEHKKQKLHRRLVKREVKGIYRFYGYKQFANRIINMDDVQKMYKQEHNNEETESDRILEQVNIDLLIKWIQNGDVRLDMLFIKSLSHSLFICDEVHNVYRLESFNTYGLAIKLVFDYYFNTLNDKDKDYGSVRSLLLSATPLTSSATEIIPIINLLTGKIVDKKSLFELYNGEYILTQNGSAKIRNAIAGRVSYIMDDNPREYPSSNFIGDKIKGIDYIKFVRTKPKENQLRLLQKWTIKDPTKNERGSNMIKDIIFPPTEEHPEGVYFSGDITELSSLPSQLAVHKLTNGNITSPILKIPTLNKFSSKYSKMVHMCLEMKSTESGKIFIYHPFVQGSGVNLITSILNANGFVMFGEQPIADSICMDCSSLYGNHKKDSHDYRPVQYTVITGSLSKASSSYRLGSFNGPDNMRGEQIKIIVGSKAMRESHTLKACRNIIIAHEPSSISELIQIVGRGVRKKSHIELPIEEQNVKIYLLTTDVSSIKNVSGIISINEEMAYKIKVLQYEQINKIDKIMYDVSIDYLINFRFKQRETPTLIGQGYDLDMKRYNAYNDTLLKSYASLRQGVAPHGIHTNRFNIFHFEGEVRLVTMIIKRILLNHQPIATIEQIRTLIRNPPFHVEYNTQLISDESIAVSVSEIVFDTSETRILSSHSHITTVDSLYDSSSTLIDTNGHSYRVICVGDPLCLDSYLVKRLYSSIIDNDNSMIDSFKQQYVVSNCKPIDLLSLSQRWSDTIDIDDILSSCERLFIKGDIDKIAESLNKLPVQSHADVVERLIEESAKVAFRERVKYRDSQMSLETILHLLEFYTSRSLIFNISDLKRTTIYDRYKKYDTITGDSWYSKRSKSSTAGFPIGHTILNRIRIYQPIDSTWLELKTIAEKKPKSHPYKIYLFEERDFKNLNVSVKIIRTNEELAKGIMLKFLPMDELQEIAKSMKIPKIHNIMKSGMVDQILQEARKIQQNIYPKRIYYSLLEI